MLDRLGELPVPGDVKQRMEALVRGLDDAGDAARHIQAAVADEARKAAGQVRGRRRGEDARPSRARSPALGFPALRRCRRRRRQQIAEPASVSSEGSDR